MSLADLFPDGDYRFHLTLRRADPQAFFAPQDSTGRVLAERGRWLTEDVGRYAAVRAQGEPALREFATMASTWFASPALVADDRTPPLDAIVAVSRLLEPDILFLSADAQGQFRLNAGALCFPTGWALTEKLGQPLESIHRVVPGLNATLGSPIQQFLSKLRPGAAFLRDNWGIAATDELNLHPARRIPAPETPTSLDRLWLRVEHQALIALPTSRGIVFGIRIALHRLDDVAAGPWRAPLRRALATMPAELVAYKRIDRILPYLLNVL